MFYYFFSCFLLKHLSRFEIGKRLNKITPDNKVSVKYTLIMAISTKGFLE